MLQNWFRRSFIAFVSVFVAKIISTVFLMSPFLVLNSPEWLINIVVFSQTIFQYVFIILYIPYAITAVLIAKSLGKNVIPLSIYFVLLPIVLYYIATSGGGIVRGIIGNALLGSTLTVYWFLSSEMDEGAAKFSFIDLEHTKTP